MVAPPQRVSAAQRVRQGAVRADRRGGVRTVDPLDEDLVLVDDAVDFGEQRSSILGWFFALLVAGIALTMRVRNCSILRTASARSDNASANFTATPSQFAQP
ncbi:hypothetical protein MOKP76_13810 [Mycobacterium avium subsp. hominissuis]